MGLVPHPSLLIVVFSNVLGVKVAVSIPEAVFEAAERAAGTPRPSRLSLYTEVLERLLAHEDSQEVTARLDAVLPMNPRTSRLASFMHSGER